jgi:very-short-patch-repair endonuclease
MIHVTFPTQCALAGLPAPVAEYRFHPTRKWRLDWCWPTEKVALEVEGGAWIGGRHTRGAGYLKDCEKYNELACAGYRLLRVTPKEIANGVALNWAEKILR